jgi:predicted amidohydrolase
MRATVRIALAQYALKSNMNLNLIRALEFMGAAEKMSAQLVVFPELCLSPFFPQYPNKSVDHYAVALEDECVEQFQAACKRLKLVASPNIYLRERGRLFDASLMIDAAGELLGVSKMVHVAQVPGFYEQDYYTPSDTGFRVYDTSLGRVGVVVCFDRHYPESIRACVLRGASLIIIPTANTMDEPRDLFVCEIRAAAYQNGVFIAMCNRVGSEGNMVFSGESIVVDPHGNVVVQADGSESLIRADIDLAQVTNARRQRPYLSLRRPEHYAAAPERY